eukprot:g3734.t1
MRQPHNPYRRRRADGEADASSHSLLPFLLAGVVLYVVLSNATPSHADRALQGLKNSQWESEGALRRELIDMETRVEEAQEQLKESAAGSDGADSARVRDAMMVDARRREKELAEKLKEERVVAQAKLAQHEKKENELRRTLKQAQDRAFVRWQQQEEKVKQLQGQVRSAQQLLKSAKPANAANGGQSRGAVIILAAPDPDGSGYMSEFDQDAVLATACAWRNFARKYGHKIIVFHTMDANQLANFHSSLKTKAPKAYASGDIQLVPVKFGYPDGISDEYLANHEGCIQCGVNRFTEKRELEGKTRQMRRCSCSCPDYGLECPIPDSEQQCWPLTYFHMNHFFTYQMWKEPALRDVDYFMRVDADLYITQELPFDPFSRMKEKQCRFATGVMGSEVRGCFEGQLKASHDWAVEAAKRGVPVYPENLSEENARGNAVYWGGFHAGDARLFKNPHHLEFAKHLNELGGVYTHRWSDQLHFPIVHRMFTEGFGQIPGENGRMTGQCLFPFFHPDSKLFVHEHRGGHNKKFWDMCTKD